MLHTIPTPQNDLNSTILLSQKENISYLFSFIGGSVSALIVITIISLVGFFYLYSKAMDIDNERLKQAYNEKKEETFFEHSLTEKVSIVGMILMLIIIFITLILSSSIENFINDYFDTISKIVL